MQEVLQADWQEVWHSPQPPFFMDSFSVLEVNVFTLFIVLSSYPAVHAPKLSSRHEAFRRIISADSITQNLP